MLPTYWSSTKYFGAALFDTIHDWDSQLQLTIAIEPHSGKKLLLTLWLWIYFIFCICVFCGFWGVFFEVELRLLFSR